MSEVAGLPDAPDEAQEDDSGLPSRDRWATVEELFHETSELLPKERAGYLEERCGGDSSLKNEVLALLGSDDLVHDLMAEPRTEDVDYLTREGVGDRWIGQTLEGFRIEGLLGRGGMGVVYMGTRVDGLLSQRVAIKLMAHHLQSTPAQSQFYMERDALAALEHPHIAKLVGGGVTPERLPFVVMEYIEGECLDKAADEPGVRLEEMARWMLQLCDAVSYVHRNLMLHRDLKPGNVMVTADGQVKLLDFGTLKGIGAGAAVDSAMTQVGMRPVTLRYASPEHIRGEAGSTALDVYSLGMTMYRLVAGRLPTVDAPSVAEYLEGLREERVTAPSSWLEPRRRMAEAALAADLDAIVLKAIRYEAKERYESADAMAEDLRRALESRPVAARGRRWTYRLGRFERRNRAVIVGAIAVCIGLGVGVIGMTREAKVARAESRRASAGVEEERKLAHLLLSDYFTQLRDIPGSTKAQTEAVTRALTYLDQLNQSSTDSSLQLESLQAYRKMGSLLGSPYEANLGDAPKAIATLERGQPLITKLLARDPHNLDYLTAAAGLETAFGQVYMGKGDGQKALPHLDSAAGYVQRVADDPHATAKMLIQAAAVYKTLADAFGEHGDASTRNPGKVVTSLEQSGAYYERALMLEPHCCQRGLTIVQATLGELLEDIDAEEAIASYKKGLAVIASLPEKEQESVGFIRLTGTLRMHLGADDLILHRKAQGEALLLPEFERERGAVMADPIDIRARTDLIDLDSTALDGYKALGERAREEALLKEYLANLDYLNRTHPENTVWKSEYTLGELRLASLLLEEHRSAEARTLASSALPVAVAAAAEPGADASALQTAADFLMEFGDGGDKEKRMALAFAERLVGGDSMPNASHLLTLARAEQRAGDGARALATASAAMGEIKAHPRRLEYASQLAEVGPLLQAQGTH